MEPIIVGVDDGHNCIKVYAGLDEKTGQPIQFKMLSRAVVGVANLGDADTIARQLVEVDGDVFTVAEDLKEYENTRNDDYQTSKLSKALVYQALRNANLPSTNLKITSGLPVDRFYSGPNKSMNQKLIAEKRETLGDMSQVFNKFDKKRNEAKINIDEIKVFCEANAAYFDVVIDNNGELTDLANELELYEGGAGVIDIGGRTTDCVVVNPNGNSLNAARSGTRDIGVLGFLDDLKMALKNELNINFISEPSLLKSLDTGFYGYGNNKRDITAIINLHKQQFFKKLESFIESTIGDGSDLPAIILVGGGSYYLKDIIQARYENIIIPEDVEFSNARGFYKIYKNFY